MNLIPSADVRGARGPQVKRCTTILIVLALTIAPYTSSASESGVGTYHNGLFDLFAGFGAPPGTFISKNYFLYWDASARVVTPDGKVESASDVNAFVDLVQAAYATHIKILGTHLGFSLIIPLVIATGQTRLGLVNLPPFSRQHSTVGGLGDVILTPAALAWHSGRFHLLTAFSAYAPTGSYDKNRFINIGRNRWSFEPDIGLTWFDQGAGREASAFIGYTVNLENMATHYRSGDEFHVDFALAQHFSHGLALGIAGYAFQQTTGDSGRGAVLGPFLGRVLALGPLAAYSVTVDDKAIDLTVKYEFEFAAQNRLAGNALWLTGALRF